jgi:hypothetical protein
VQAEGGVLRLGLLQRSIEAGMDVFADVGGSCACAKLYATRQHAALASRSASRTRGCKGWASCVSVLHASTVLKAFGVVAWMGL